MSSRRTIILVVSLVAAALAVFFVVNYTNKADTRASQDYQIRKVLRASQPIPAGTPLRGALAAGSVEEAEIIQQSFAPSMITADQEEAFLDKVALHDVVQGEFLMGGAFGDAVTENISRSNQLQEADLTAVAVSVDQVQGVAGNLTPGDYVNIVITTTPDANTSALLATQGIVSPQTYSVLYQRARILAIGANYAPTAGSKTDPNTITNAAGGSIVFAVKPEAALKIIAASKTEGGLYLTQVRSDYVVHPITPVNNVFDLASTVLKPEQEVSLPPAAA